jgi:chromosome segregation ATPase
LIAQLDQANKVKEDAIRQLKRIRNQLSELERENDEFRRTQEEGGQMGKDAANKMRSLEANVADLQEELAQALRGKRNAESERDDASEELVVANREKTAAIEEKRKTEGKVNELEEERDEIEGDLQQADDRIQQLQLSVDGKEAELMEATSKASKSESERAAAERTCRELRAQKDELETHIKNKYKNQVGVLEGKLNDLQETVDQEQKEKQSMQRQLRRADRRLRDQQTHGEDHQKIVDGLKDEVEREKRRAITLRRNNDELEEASQRANNKARRLQRDFEEGAEEIEKLTREITKLKTTARRPVRSRYKFKSNLIDDISDDDDQQSQGSGRNQSATPTGSHNNSFGAGDNNLTNNGNDQF